MTKTHRLVKRKGQLGVVLDEDPPPVVMLMPRVPPDLAPKSDELPRQLLYGRFEEAELETVGAASPELVQLAESLAESFSSIANALRDQMSEDLK